VVGGEVGALWKGRVAEGQADSVAVIAEHRGSSFP